MSTNREKYINNASNKELAKVIGIALQVYDTFISYGREDYEKLMRPLSKHIRDRYEDMFSTRNTGKFNMIEEIANWLSLEYVDKTADELFKELGYELDKDSTHSKRTIAVYKNKEFNKVIEINFNYKEYEARDYDFIKTDIDRNAEYVNEEEIKAIIKKIEEHKNDKNDWQNKSEPKEINIHIDRPNMFFTEDIDCIVFTFDSINKYFGKEKYCHYMVFDDNRERLSKEWHPIIHTNKIPLNSKYIQFMDNIGEQSSIYPIEILKNVGKDI